MAIFRNKDDTSEKWKEKYLTNIKENAWWSDKLESILFWGREKSHVLEYEKWIDGLSTTDVQQTAKKLFSGKNEFVSILNPED